VVTAGAIQVVIDETRCIGSGNCLYNEPAVFDQNEDDGMAILLNEHPGPELLDTVRQAVLTCPGQAIRLIIESSDDGAD
jgi:ferredoxin